MEWLFVIGGFVLSIPVMAIVALVRTGKLREVLEQTRSEHSREIEFLRSNVECLQREVRELSGRESGSPSAPQAVAAATPVAAVEPQPQAVAASHRPAPGPTAAQPIPTNPAQGVPTLIPAMSGQSVKAGEPAHAEASARPQYVQPTPQRSVSVPPPSPPAQPVSAFSAPPQPLRESLREWLGATLPLEEMLGLNVFAKIGIVLLVLGLALLGRVALLAMGPAARVGLIYAAGGVLLGGGIWLERKERYRLLGRSGIGGGWALLFFTTYALSHVAPMAILQSNTADCVLMLIVAIGMVAHTLRYRSQVVTGLAFLLAFSTVALSQDTVYSLVSGVILALGIVAIALRMGWFELEIFGIIASFANHFYWLYKLYPEGVAGHPFSQFWPSCIILILYWAVFRISYVVRRIRSPRDEMFSTIAALVNPVLLLAIMKFQAMRPELAFYALLGLGVLEFFFGQLTVTRRGRPAFILLSVLGAILVFAAVPFKFSGNNIALLWMIAAGVLLVAGIVQKEVVFRRLGLICGLFTGPLVIYEASSIVILRQTSHAPLTEDGVLLLACSVAFYITAYLLRLRWKPLFAGVDEALAIGQSYLGAVAAFLGSWALLAGDETAVAWAVLMLAYAYGKRRLHDNNLLVQTIGFAVAVLVAVFTLNIHGEALYPHHVAGRLITLPVLACAFYLAYWILGEGEDGRAFARRLALWSGSAMLATLAWTDVKATWLAPVGLAFAALLSLGGRRLAIADLIFQEQVLAVMAAAQLAVWNIDAPGTFERYGPLVGCAAIYYAISRFCTMRNAAYARPAAWAHTCAGTAFLASLAWHEAPQSWLAVVWVLFALALALTDRILGGEELPWQAHTLAALAVIRAVTLNFYIGDRWHGIHVRLFTISILVAVLYALARWIRLPASFETGQARHSYTWTASILVAWLLWGELQPIGVAVGWAILGLVLFEIGYWRDIRPLRVQGYAGLIGAFVRIFFANLTVATLPGQAISPRIYTVVPIAAIFFLVWAQLRSRRDTSGSRRVSLTDLIAYLGATSIAGLLYVEVQPERVILAWAVLVAGLLTSSLLLGEEVFLHQGQLLTVGIAVRGLAHNVFGGSYFTESGCRGSIGVLSLTSAVLLLSLLVAFRLRARYGERDQAGSLIRNLVRRPEQFLFFTPVLLMTLAIAVKLHPGMVTLSWGIEGVAVIVLGLIAGQRFYRLTGLLLLLLCVGKIVVRDAWHLEDFDRYITFIALGAALTLVSTLYGKYRETVRKLL
jgi:hypothetical protein